MSSVRRPRRLHVCTGRSVAVGLAIRGSSKNWHHIPPHTLWLVLQPRTYLVNSIESGRKQESSNWPSHGLRCLKQLRVPPVPPRHGWNLPCRSCRSGTRASSGSRQARCYTLVPHTSWQTASPWTEPAHQEQVGQRGLSRPRRRLSRLLVTQCLCATSLISGTHTTLITSGMMRCEESSPRPIPRIVSTPAYNSPPVPSFNCPVLR